MIDAKVADSAISAQQGEAAKVAGLGLAASAKMPSLGAARRSTLCPATRFQRDGIESSLVGREGCGAKKANCKALRIRSWGEDADWL